VRDYQTKDLAKENCRISTQRRANLFRVLLPTRESAATDAALVPSAKQEIIILKRLQKTFWLMAMMEQWNHLSGSRNKATVYPRYAVEVLSAQRNDQLVLQHQAGQEII